MFFRNKLKLPRSRRLAIFALASGVAASTAFFSQERIFHPSTQATPVAKSTPLEKGFVINDFAKLNKNLMQNGFIAQDSLSVYTAQQLGLGQRLDLLRLSPENRRVVQEITRSAVDSENEIANRHLALATYFLYLHATNQKPTAVIYPESSLHLRPTSVLSFRRPNPSSSPEVHWTKFYNDLKKAVLNHPDGLVLIAHLKSLNPAVSEAKAKQAVAFATAETRKISELNVYLADRGLPALSFDALRLIRQFQNSLTQSQPSLVDTSLRPRPPVSDELVKAISSLQEATRQTTAIRDSTAVASTEHVYPIALKKMVTKIIETEASALHSELSLADSCRAFYETHPNGLKTKKDVDGAISLVGLERIERELGSTYSSHADSSLSALTPPDSSSRFNKLKNYLWNTISAYSVLDEQQTVPKPRPVQEYKEMMLRELEKNLAEGNFPDSLSMSVDGLPVSVSFATPEIHVLDQLARHKSGEQLIKALTNP